jgi:alkylation response protein AidB-like acyl-CoA dehydrogenase
MMSSDDDAGERHKAVAAAKVQIGRSGRKIGQEAVQLHGGIGVTMEYMVGHYFKRMSMLELLFGDADTHLAQLAKAGGVLEAT